MGFAALGLSAVVAVGGGIWWGASIVSSLGESSPDITAIVSSTPTAAADATATAAAKPVSNACTPGEGDRKSGEGVITALEHAYYKLRSGQAVRDLMVANSSLPDAATIQAGIDSVPVGTAYCLEVTAIGPNTYSAQITEVRPTEQSQFKQRISTWTEPDGTVRVRSIDEVGE